MTAKERDFVIGHGFGEIYAFIKAAGGLPWSLTEFEEAVYKARLALFEKNGARVLPGAREVVRKAVVALACCARHGFDAARNQPDAERARRRGLFCDDAVRRRISVANRRQYFARPPSDSGFAVALCCN